jgi:hypothetical protein
MRFALTYDDIHALGVLASYAGKGSEAVLPHPETIVRCLKQLEHWTRLSLLHRKTRLHCFECQTVQTVTDGYSNRFCKLKCGHTRSVHTMSDSEYADLVERANGLQVTGRNARVGGWDLVSVEGVK